MHRLRDDEDCSCFNADGRPHALAICPTAYEAPARGAATAWFAPDSALEEDGFELLVPVVKRRPPREMEPGLCRTGPHFQRRMMALEGSFRFSHSARSSSGIFVSVSGYPRQR
jgi:hypothetical protein